MVQKVLLLLLVIAVRPCGIRLVSLDNNLQYMILCTASFSVIIMTYLHCWTGTRTLILDICPKNGYSDVWGSRSESESESVSVQWEHFMYSLMYLLCLASKSELVCETVSCNVKVPLQCNVFDVVIAVIYPLGLIHTKRMSTEKPTFP